MNDPLNDVLLMENHSEEENQKEVKVSKESCSFEKQNCPNKNSRDKSNQLRSKGLAGYIRS